jgi:PAS domain-containing protein
LWYNNKDKFVEKIVEIIVQNADKIGIGAICFGLLVMLFFSLKWFSRFLDKDQEKDQRLLEIHIKAINAADGLAETAVSVKEATDSMKVGQEQFRDFVSNIPGMLKAFSDNFSGVTTQINANIITAEKKIIDFIETRSIRKGIVIVDPLGKITTCNHDALILTNLTSNQLINTNLSDWSSKMISPDGFSFKEGETVIDQVMLAGVPSRNNIVGFNSPSGLRWYILDAEPVINIVNNKILKVIVTFRDIGELIISDSN